MSVWRNHLAASLVLFLAVFLPTFALAATPQPASAQKMCRLVETYAREELKLSGVVCTVSLEKSAIDVFINVNGKDGKQIFMDMALLAPVAASAAEWSQLIHLYLHDGKKTLADVTIPTRVVRQYINDEISTSKFFKAWKAADHYRLAQTTKPDGADLLTRAKKIYRHDLDGDGRREFVLLVPSGTDEAGAYYQLVVLDANKQVIWSGPKALDSENPMVFGEWDYGLSMPDVIGDVDGDGFVELVFPAPQSDVSPTTLRILRWHDRTFKLVRQASLIETPKGSGQFLWKKPGGSTGLWVISILSVNSPGVVTADLMGYRGGNDAVRRKGTLKAISGSYQLVRGPSGAKTPAPANNSDGPGIIGKSCDDLWLARNRIFANKGYCFKTKKARAAFPDSCFAPYGKLTRRERQQVEQIRRRERQLGCR